MKEGRAGQKHDFTIDTRNSGAGTLTVTMDGPSKVSMDCTEVDEGYKVRYTPLFAGEYYCTIKYNQIHIVGSPFKVIIAGDKVAEGGAEEESATVSIETVVKTFKGGRYVRPIMPVFKSDASKVTVAGNGLKKALVNKQNLITLSAGLAGDEQTLKFLY